MPAAKHWEEKSSHEGGLRKILSFHSTLKGQEGHSAVDIYQAFNPRQEPLFQWYPDIQFSVKVLDAAMFFRNSE